MLTLLLKTRSFQRKLIEAMGAQDLLKLSHRLCCARSYQINTSLQIVPLPSKPSRIEHGAWQSEQALRPGVKGAAVKEQEPPGCPSSPSKGLTRGSCRSGGQPSEHTLPCENLLAPCWRVWNNMETLALPVWLAFISLWMRISKKSALLLSLINFPFQLWVFFLFCLPSALLEWFLNICTETKTSGIVCRCHPCKEKLDTVMNVGRITSLYFNFEGTLWC